MTDQELIAALRRNMAETGSLRCLGCGHEHGCSTHGCAVLREAAERIEQLGEQQENNPPLTLDELRRMDGEPVRIIFYSKTSKCGVWNGWALVDLRFPAMEFLEHNLKFEYYGKSWLAYRRKPEEETK